MDTTSLYYFQELSKDLHMTRTAERLFISQQTLSNHILRLEKQLGCQLLYRKPSLSLTYAGEQVLAFAERTLRDQDNLTDILADVENQTRGLIRFGASTLRMGACLPFILPWFSKEYPNVQVRVTDRTTRQLEPLVLSGDLDFALVAGDARSGKTRTDKQSVQTERAGSDYDSGRKALVSGKSLHFRDEPEIQRELMLRDPVFLCITDSLMRQYFGARTQELAAKYRNGTNLSPFKEMPFLLFENRLGRMIDLCFEEAGYTPHVCLSAPLIQPINHIGLLGIAAFFSTAVALTSVGAERREDLHVFPLLHRGRPLYQEIYLIRSGGRYVPRYAARFLELLKDCFQTIEGTEPV